MNEQLPRILQDEIDAAIKALRDSLTGVGLDMHLRNIEGAVANILGWVQTTPTIVTAADNARDQVSAFMHFIDRRRPFLDEEQKAEAKRELRDAEQAIQDFAATLHRVPPSTKASHRGIGW